jgi:hypothetical protein
VVNGKVKASRQLQVYKIAWEMIKRVIASRRSLENSERIGKVIHVLVKLIGTAIKYQASKRWWEIV